MNSFEDEAFETITHRLQQQFRAYGDEYADDIALMSVYAGLQHLVIQHGIAAALSVMSEVFDALAEDAAHQRQRQN